MNDALSPPEIAQAVFADRLALAQSYVGWLADAGTVRGLIGPREVPRLWDRHVLNCAVIGEVIPAGSSVVDLGAGAGLPGIPLALARPDLEVTLVEPLERRALFLREVVADLALSSVEVVHGRAESLHGRRTFAVVTSRALAPLDRLLGWSWPLVAPGGAMVAMKGSRAAEEIDAARAALRRLGATAPEILPVGAGIVDPPTTVVRIARGRGSVKGSPRARR